MPIGAENGNPALGPSPCHLSLPRAVNEALNADERNEPSQDSAQPVDALPHWNDKQPAPCVHARGKFRAVERSPLVGLERDKTAQRAERPRGKMKMAATA